MSKLNVDQKTIKDLFQDKRADFLIPDYQRPYAWGETECQTLWDDIFSFAIPDDTLIPFYFLFFMVFFPKYSEKRLICTIYFYLPDFLAPFWHRKPWSKRFSSTANRCYSTNFILHR